jgi:predicted ester cyclase
MSRKKEYAKKFVIEVVGLNNLDVLDEILHPEYYAERHLTQKDKDWNSKTSWLKIISPRGSDEKHLTIAYQGTPSQTGIEPAKRRMDKMQYSNYLIPNFQVQVHSIVEERNNVVVMFTNSFVHDKAYYGINPTYQKIEYNAVFSFTFLDSKIVKLTLLNDTYWILAEMGEIILRQGDDEQIQQYMEMLKRQKLIP